MERRSIVLDSNLLLLLTVGLWNPRAIASQKRLSGLSADDFDLLQTFLVSFETIVTTAHILTEVSNLAGAASGQSRRAIFDEFASLCRVLDERGVNAADVTDKAEFGIFGLTDAVLSQLSQTMLLLTQDGRLAAHLRNQGILVLSLRDVRALRDQAGYA